MNLMYRPATSADIPALAILGAETFMDTFGHLYSRENADRFLGTVHSIEGVKAAMKMPGVAYLLAEDDSGLIGYCKIGPLKLPVAPGGKAQELYQLYVRQNQFGRGVAQHLMDWAMEKFRARGAGEIYLSVWSENPRAQRFYQKYGFEKVGDYRFMVGEQEDHDFIFRAKLT